MEKYVPLVLVFVVILSSGCVGGGVTGGITGEGTNVCFNGRCFIVEVADTPKEIMTGLMGRESLDMDKGMLFVFDSEDEHGFWMKNMEIPLDIIWISSDREVVFISRETLPCGNSCPSIKPGRKAKYVLEINAGLSDEIGLQVGDEMQIK